MHPMVRVASNEESGEISTRTLTKDRFLLDEVNSSIQIGFPIALAILERARTDLHESFKCGNFTQRRIVLSSSLLGVWSTVYLRRTSGCPYTNQEPCSKTRWLFSGVRNLNRTNPLSILENSISSFDFQAFVRDSSTNGKNGRCPTKNSARVFSQ